MDIKAELEQLKAKNERAKNSKARLEGQLETKKEEMLQAGCNSVEELKVKIDELEISNEKTRIELEKKIEELNEYFTT